MIAVCVFAFLCLIVLVTTSGSASASEPIDEPIDEPVGGSNRPTCGVRMSSIVQPGYAGPYKGWYDNDGCGKKNNYCRWSFGNNGHGGNPADASGLSFTSMSVPLWVCSRGEGPYGSPVDEWNFTTADRA